jgi:hypothetical protein
MGKRKALELSPGQKKLTSFFSRSPPNAQDANADSGSPRIAGLQQGAQHSSRVAQHTSPVRTTPARGVLRQQAVSLTSHRERGVSEHAGIGKTAKQPGLPALGLSPPLPPLVQQYKIKYEVLDASHEGITAGKGHDGAAGVASAGISPAQSQPRRVKAEVWGVSDVGDPSIFHSNR